MKPAQQKDRLKRLITYYAPQKKHLAADMAFAITGAGLSIIIPLLIRYITNELTHENPEGALQTVIVLLGALLLLLAAAVYCHYFVSCYGHLMGTHIEFAMRNDIFSHYQKLSFRFFDNQKVGQLMARVTNDLHDISEMLHHAPEEIVISSIKFFGTFILLLCIDWRLTAVAVVPMPFLLWFAMVYNKKLRHAYARNRAKMASVNETIESNLSGIREVMSFGNEESEIEKFTEGNAFFVESKRDTYRHMAIYNSVLNAAATFITIAVAGAGAIMYFITSIQLDLSDLILFMLCIHNFTEPIDMVVKITEWIHSGLSGFDRFLQIMDIEPEIKNSPNAEVLHEVKGDIEFENVSFSYEKGSDVFSNLSFSVAAGEYVALVGASGVGKSTLCSLIPRFYDVTGGSVKVDGRDVKSVTTDSLRAHIGIVQQDAHLFTGTIGENIRFGNKRASNEEVIAAAKKAHAHEFIMALPDGYDTHIGYRGTKLSSGEQQRLAIARLFLKNPQILILDEATSMLDPESELTIQTALDELAENRTTFVIAHRLSTVYNAKRILVLTKDGIVEQGSHEYLMQVGCVYASLYNKSLVQDGV